MPTINQLVRKSRGNKTRKSIRQSNGNNGKRSCTKS